MSATAKVYDYETIAEGMEFTEKYEITNKVYQGFLSTFGDHNPLHTDDAHAVANGFTGKVMHGAILNGFVSHFVGMCFPGKKSVLLSTEMYYLKPSYLGDQLVLKAKVSQTVEAHHVLVLTVMIENTTRHSNVAKAKIQVKVLG